MQRMSGVMHPLSPKRGAIARGHQRRRRTRIGRISRGRDFLRDLRPIMIDLWSVLRRGHHSFFWQFVHKILLWQASGLFESRFSKIPVPGPP